MKTTHLHGRHFRGHLTTYQMTRQFHAAKVALARSLGGGVDEASGAGFRPDVMTCAWMEGVSEALAEPWGLRSVREKRRLSFLEIPGFLPFGRFLAFRGRALAWVSGPGPPQAAQKGLLTLRGVWGLADRGLAGGW